jgi:hypothetical protein
METMTDSGKDGPRRVASLSTRKASSAPQAEKDARPVLAGGTQKRSTKPKPPQAVEEQHEPIAVTEEAFADASSIPAGAGPAARLSLAKRGVQAAASRFRHRPIAAGVLAVLLGIIGWLAFEYSSQGSTISRLDTQNSLRTTALTAATTYGGWVSSYNYTDLTSPSSTWSKIEAHSTPTFRASFIQTSRTLQSTITAYKSISQGTVVSTGLQSLSGNQAAVLVFIRETIRNTAQSSPSTVNFLVSISLVHQGGQWLINDVKDLSAQSAGS